jgi:anti-anti-sigma regulatory factor
MPDFSVHRVMNNGVMILRTEGYLDEMGGLAVFKEVQEAIGKGILKFLLDFSSSPVINSQGIAQIIELAEVVVDEHSGALGFTGLNELTSGVFSMVGLTTMGQIFPDEPTALRNL